MLTQCFLAFLLALYRIFLIEEDYPLILRGFSSRFSKVWMRAFILRTYSRWWTVKKKNFDPRFDLKFYGILSIDVIHSELNPLNSEQNLDPAIIPYQAVYPFSYVPTYLVEYLIRPSGSCHFACINLPDQVWLCGRWSVMSLKRN